MFARLSLKNLIKRRSYSRTKTFSWKGKCVFGANMVVSVALSGVGDFIEQSYEMCEQPTKKWDSTRTMNMSATGLPTGALTHFWYKMLDARLPGSTFRIVMKKVLWDQLLFSPICICTFFVTLALLENSSKTEMIDEISKKAWKLYVGEWFIWPPAQVINFYFLPLKYRLMYDNCISLIYDVYTSHVKYYSPPACKSNDGD